MRRAEVRFDEFIHAPTRLQIASVLIVAERAEFGFVRDTTGLSDSALSKQVRVMEEAGYVDVEKGYVGKRPRTWLRLSKIGRAAFEGHLAALRLLPIPVANGSDS